MMECLDIGLVCMKIEKKEKIRLKFKMKRNKKIIDDLFYLGTSIFGCVGLGSILFLLLRINETQSNTLTINPNSIGELGFEILMIVFFLFFIVLSFSRYLINRIKNHV